MWWSILWNLISGNLGGIVSAITGYLGKMSDNDTTKFVNAVGADKEVAVAQLQSSATIYHDRADMLKGFKVTQWLIAIALIPALYHQGGVFLDSCPIFHTVGSWNFVALPHPYDEREWSLIASLLGIQTGLTVGLGAIKMLLRR